MENFRRIPASANEAKHMGMAPQLLGAIFTSSFLFLLSILAGWIFPLELPTLRLLALMAGAGLFVQGLTKGRPSRWSLLCAVVASGALVLARTSLAIIAALGALGAAVLPAETVWAQAVCSYAAWASAFALLYHLAPQWAGAMEASAGRITNFLSFTGPLDLGFYAAGLPVAAVTILTLTLISASHRRVFLRPAAWGMAAILVGWIIYVQVRGFFPSMSLLQGMLWGAAFALYCVAVAGAILGFAPLYKAENYPNKCSPELDRGMRWARIIAVGAAFIAAMLVWILCRPLPLQQKFTVGIWRGNQMGLWDKPSWKQPGVELTSAHFGMLETYLQAFGWKTHRIGPELAGPELQKLDVVLILNPRQLSESTIKALQKYVFSGGGLLLAGDHTDLYGIRAPLNKLLEPAGIQLADDTAMPLREGWLGSLSETGDWMSLTGLSAAYTGYGVGASLMIHGGAKPYLIGHFCLSDAANPTNIAHGRLGDYQPGRGERIDGLALVARAKYGQGQIVMCGDTSSFQSLALPRSAFFCRHLIEQAAAKSANTFPFFLRQIRIWGPGAVACLLLLALLFAGLSEAPIRSLILLFIALALNLSTREARLQIFQYAHNLQGKIALVDGRHANGYDPRGMTPNSIDGLYLTLMREGYVPLEVSNFFDRGIWRKGRLIAIVGPHKGLATDETKMIIEAVAKGSTLLLACGWHERAASQPLLRALEIDILPIPLGPVPYVDEAAQGPWLQQPRFYDCWPLVVPPACPIRPFYEAEIGGKRWTIMAIGTIGAGHVIIFGDASFFRDDNLEGRQWQWLPNLQFLRLLLMEQNNARPRPSS